MSYGRGKDECRAGTPPVTRRADRTSGHSRSEASGHVVLDLDCPAGQEYPRFEKNCG